MPFWGVFMNFHERLVEYRGKFGMLIRPSESDQSYLFSLGNHPGSHVWIIYEVGEDFVTIKSTTEDFFIMIPLCRFVFQDDPRHRD